MMIWFWHQYLKDKKLADLPTVSPLSADDLRDLPPALVLTAEYDPLCDDVGAYAGKLESAGIPANLSRYEGVIHGFFRMTSRLEKARQALEEVSMAIKQALLS